MFDIISKLIHENEDEYHDFKKEWYGPNKKDELIKDIFSFVNTAHHKDCYLIIGVDDNKKVVGVENDENRRNTQKLTDFLNNLPLANNAIPRLIVESLTIEEHTVDVIVIKDCKNVPIYLKELYPSKNSKIHTKNHIYPGQIFCRLNDTNTPIDKTARDDLVEKLWKKRFGEDLTIEEQYKIKLLDIDNWQYSEDGETRFLYKVDPNYCMYLKDDIDEDIRFKIESYSLSQMRIRVNWKILNLQYKDRLIKRFTVLYLDEYRFLTIYPQTFSLDQNLDKPLIYRFILADSIDFYVENFLLNQKNTFSPSPDYFQKDKLLEGIVVFKNSEQKNSIDKKLKKNISAIREEIQPSDSQLNSIQKKVTLEFNKKDKVSNNEIVAACRELNLGRYINDFIIYNTNEVNPINWFSDNFRG